MQALRQLESHARAAQRFAGIVAARLIGIHYRQSLGHAIGAGQMVIGDDQVHAQALRCFRRGKGANAHVHADDQPDAGGRGALDDVVAHVVAVANAVRDMEVGGAAAEFDGSLQDDDGGGAVHVVVAVDEDGFFALDGGIEPVDRRLHAAHQIGRVKMSERGREKARGGFGVRNVAREQEARQSSQLNKLPKPGWPWSATPRREGLSAPALRIWGSTS